MNGKELHYGGFWRRVAAYVIDYLVLSILGLAVVGLGIWLEVHNYLGSTDQLEVWGNLIWFLLIWLYFAGMESSAKQATLGKLAAGLVVTDLQEERITFLRATCRNLAKILSILILLIGFVMVAFTKRKQGLHDKLTSCLVIKRNKSRLFRVFLLIFLFWVLVIGGLGYFVYVSVLPQLFETVQEQFQVPDKSSATPSAPLQKTTVPSEMSKTGNSEQVTIEWVGGTYTGEVSDGVPHGQGTLTRADGSKYVGEWKHDKEWEGTSYLASGEIEATYSDGERCESCTITYSNGDQYAGDISNGVPHGEGTYIYANGDKYVGEFKSFSFHGLGAYFFATGNRYDGEWEDDKQSGQGTFIWANGDQYVGGFKDGERHGSGTLTWANGTEYVGQWKNGKRFPEVDKSGSGEIKTMDLDIAPPDLKVSGATVVVGPSLLQLLEQTWNGDIGIKVFLSAIPEVQSGLGDVNIGISRVVDENNRDFYDQEKDQMFNSGVLHDLVEGDDIFSSERQIKTAPGFEVQDLKSIEGNLIITLPINLAKVTFKSDQIGVAKTTSGTTITLLKVEQEEDDAYGNKKSFIEFHYKGPANSYRGVKGYNSEGKEVTEGGGSRLTGDGDVDQTLVKAFYAPEGELQEGDPLPVKIELFIAEKTIDYTYPFVLNK